MSRYRLAQSICALTGIAVGAYSCITVAVAQNYDANLQVRFGSFLQGAAVVGDGSLVTTTTPAPTPAGPGVPTSVSESGPLGYFSKGIGFVSGIEIVNKRGWNYGVEIDAAFMDGRSTRFDQQFGIDYIVTARGRLGRHVRPDLLWYASTGPALRGSDFTSQTKINRTRLGWSFGTGLEWDYGGGILFGEYVFAGFGSVSHELTNNTVTGTVVRAYDYDAHAHMFRIGLKFKVGHDHYYHDDVAERIGRRQEPLK